MAKAKPKAESLPPCAVPSDAVEGGVEVRNLDMTSGPEDFLRVYQTIPDAEFARVFCSYLIWRQYFENDQRMRRVYEENPSSASMVEQDYVLEKSKARERAIELYTSRFQEKLNTSPDARRAFLSECWGAMDQQVGKPAHFGSPENFLIRTIKLSDHNFLRRFAAYVAALAPPEDFVEPEALYQTYLKDYVAIFENHGKSRPARLDFLKQHWKDRTDF